MKLISEQFEINHKMTANVWAITQRNRYPETGCNGAPSLSIKTDFHVNFTETFSDGIRVFMNGNRRTLPRPPLLLTHGHVIQVTPSEFKK